MFEARGGEKFGTRKNTLQWNGIVENTNPQFARARVVPGNFLRPGKNLRRPGNAVATR